MLISGVCNQWVAIIFTKPRNSYRNINPQFFVCFKRKPIKNQINHVLVDLQLTVKLKPLMVDFHLFRCIKDSGFRFIYLQQATTRRIHKTQNFTKQSAS